MSHIEALKEQARRHEQKESWRSALDLYERAIDRLVQEDAPDIGLYNRVGDLYIRVGEYDPAVKSFQQAIELYVDSGLPNNAIAVCKKILRNVPDRAEVFLRMGQIRAEQGFMVDARTHFLTYAERMQAAGRLDDAVQALVEFADAVPEDVDIRLSIAEHFEHRGHEEEALGQLAAGYVAARDGGMTDRVEEFGERIAALRPDEDLEELVRAFTAPLEGDEEPELLTIDDAWDFGDAQPLAEGSAEAAEAGTALEGFETTALEEAPEAAEVVGEAVEEARAAELFEDAADAIPDEVVAEVDEAFQRAEEGFEDIAEADSDEALVELVREGDFASEVVEIDDEEDLDDDEDLDAELPFLHVPDGDDGAPAPVDEEAAWTADDDEPTSVEESGDTPLHEPWTETQPPAAPVPEIADEPEPAPAASAPTDAVPADLDPPVLPVDAAPSVLDLRQRAVEEAIRSGDEGALVGAYVDLAEALRDSGAEGRAQAILRQALHLAPNDARAQAALAELEPGERPVTEVASSEDYVDLGALILGDDDEKTTRFVVAYEEPSGDEQADFMKMLSQFKAKVAENVDASDVRAHHDLGTAYKEMGLLDEAVEEFQAALRASADHLPTYEMLGQTFLERGAPEAAVRVLSRALEARYDVEDELLGIYYFLGVSHEECGNLGEAREFYERVFSLDINFADVTERLRELRG
ncbi:MAG: tetratricopeptide repeat protein [Gemmatimonadetes bacterium]|nr:tetratricopeptide repeat protein [Gemmatimonadota bacterium]